MPRSPVRSRTEGTAMSEMIAEFFRRNAKILALTFFTYAALC